jgi:hypothetical protein
VIRGVVGNGGDLRSDGIGLDVNGTNRDFGLIVSQKQIEAKYCSSICVEKQGFRPPFAKNNVIDSAR